MSTLIPLAPAESHRLPPIWDTLHRIQSTLGIKRERLAEMLALKPSELERLRRRQKEPLLTSIMSLCQHLNLGIENVTINDIDYLAMSRQFFGEHASLPEKYAVYAQSKRRTVVSLLNYVEARFGWQTRAQVLRRFQMTEAMFENPDAPINLRFSVDLCSWLLRFHRDPGVLLDMGANAVRTHLHSPVGHELSSSRNLRELFERMFDSVAEQYIERNFKWTIASADAFAITLRGVPDAELVAKLGTHYMHSLQGCLIRQGFVSSIPAYLGQPNAVVEKRRCVRADHAYCEYWIDLRPAIRADKKTGSGSRLALC